MVTHMRHCINCLTTYNNITKAFNAAYTVYLKTYIDVYSKAHNAVNTQDKFMYSDVYKILQKWVDAGTSYHLQNSYV